MVVCHCVAVNHLVIQKLADRGCLTVEDVIARCGAGSRCGGCHETIESLVAAARGPE